MTPTTLVVMEPGSHWPAHIDNLTSVVGLGSIGDDLLDRTRRKLALLGRGKCPVRVAVLACNPAAGTASAGGRGMLARALLAAVSQAIHGRLILSAADGASHQLRGELLTLAGELTGEIRGTSASVSLFFTPHESVTPSWTAMSAVVDASAPR